jgi:hypothetical protein
MMENERTPRLLCAMCMMPKPLEKRWAWLRLCVECSAPPKESPEAALRAGPRAGATYRADGRRRH